MNYRPLLALLGAVVVTMTAWPNVGAHAEEKPAPPQPVPVPYPNLAAEVDSHISKGSKGAATLKAMAAEAAPATLTAADRGAYVDYSAWVGTVADRISAAVASLSTARDHYRAKPSDALLKELSAANDAYLALQAHLLDEHAKRPAVPNIMKTKHDTVKNSISNIR